VTVTFGGQPHVQPQTFFIHSGLLKGRAKLFDKIVEGSKAVCLPNFSPEIGSVYVHWLYTRKVLTGTSLTTDLPALVHAWALGAYLNDSDFENAVMNAIVLLISESQPFGWQLSVKTEMINLVYESTTAGSPLRRLMVDIWIRCGNERYLGEECKDTSPFFLADLVTALLPAAKARPEAKASTLDSICKYHVHKLKEACDLAEAPQREGSPSEAVNRLSITGK